MPREIPKPISRLLLNYINRFSDPQEFVGLVRDDPLYKRRRGIGLRTSVARAIYEYRLEKPGQRFESVEELLNVRGLGDDTYHDILTSFIKLTPAQRDFANELIDTANQVIDAWQSGKLRMFLATTRWVKVDGGATGW